ncbi:MAG: 30S ribosomal protein S6 [Candidatus Pacebacteria bacterium]|nr:30S ribosomal protein S6 [Candidatus Paceibacterota bacterium]
MNTIYELAYLISGQLDEKKAKELEEKTEKSIKENSGVVLGSIELKKIKLAYIIKKQQDGYLSSIDFTCEPASLAKISKETEKEPDVLRFLIIKKSLKKPEEEKKERTIKKPVEVEQKEQESVEEKIETPKEPIIKEKKKKEKPADKKHKEEDLKKIEEDLDEILGQ